MSVNQKDWAPEMKLGSQRCPHRINLEEPVRVASPHRINLEEPVRVASPTRKKLFLRQSVSLSVRAKRGME